jgi:CRISPR-associated protein Csd2
MSPISNRYDFVLLFDVKDGNPNGDPDAGNLPRVDVQTGHGLVTDVCLKRKIRNYVGLLKEEQPPYEIYVKEKAVLNAQHDRAYQALGVDSKASKGGKDVDAARDWMCQNFYDVRTFGAVMSTGTNCGQVRGPIQLTFARSNDPIVASEHSITRMAVTTQAESDKQQGGNRTMGRKFTIPYGLYRASGFISAPLSRQTGFSEDDLSLFWDALKNMFEHDHSASRGMMTVCGLYVFRHDSSLGNAPAYELFERITMKLKEGIDAPRDISDYTIQINTDDLPTGVTLESMVHRFPRVLEAV